MDSESGSSITSWWAQKKEALLELTQKESPLYVYDEETIKNAINRLKTLTALDRLFYAIKANPNSEGD